MSIGQIMSKKLITLEIDDHLDKAKALFEQHKIHHILVLNNKELAGILTDRDLYKQLSPYIGTSKETPRDSTLLHKKVHLVMTRELVTTTINSSINDVVMLFYKEHISCLPIVDENFHPIGIISWRDIIKVAALQHLKKIAKAKT
ncbi:CBS domain-containing protein [Thalassotalea piscium]|uniref:Acetoin utilization protein AcuB n=1 Tax=Thalassotalea piscium TaxID=1230533 RepID=A0A7X0NHT5_9GAMM|nr:CBS domain-containing protein [Thalassotalea piscium]MBB6543576.1 acetoin utilization protein AcuB [Thalassotalea piscium]